MRTAVSHAYPVLVGVVLGVGWFLRIEPAPYEYGMVVLVSLGVVARLLKFPRSLLLPGILLGGFLAFSTVSLVNARELWPSIRYLFITVYLAISGVFFLGFSIRYGPRGLSWVWRGYLAAGLIAAALGYLGVIGTPGFEGFQWGEARAVAGFKDPNVYAAFLVPVILYAFHRLQYAKGLSTAWWALVFGVLAAGQILGFSRAAWLNLLLALMCFPVLARRLGWPGVARGGIGAVCAVGLLGLAVCLNPMVVSLQANRFGGAMFTEYDQDRFTVQSKIVRPILERPWGIGPGETERVFDYAAHNLYLRVLGENGWGAGLFLLMLLGLSLWVVLRPVLAKPKGEGRSLQAAVAAAFVGTLVNSFFIDSLHWRHFWLLLALVWCSGFVPSGGMERMNEREA